MPNRCEFRLRLPNICIGEARQAIRSKCQPRKEADALRHFLSWAAPAGTIGAGDATIARTVLDKYESSIRQDLGKLDENLKTLASMLYVDIFGLDDEMLRRATELALAGIAPRPFDHAILAGILVSAQRLWDCGERGLSFCEKDTDLQPWGQYGDSKPPLRDAYDQAHIWVYGDFTLTQPARRPDFE
jgi:hypothetical protein